MQGKDRKLRWPFGWPGQGHFSTSPVLCDGVLISNAGAWLRGLDATTGQVLWAHPNAEEIGQNMANPRVVTIGGERYVVAVSAEVVRVRDGQIIGKLPGTVSAKMEIDGPIVAGDRIVLISGEWRDRELVCVRPRLENGTLATEELWRVKKSARRGFGTWRTVARDGLVYSKKTILDTATGALVKEGLPAAHGGYCWDAGLILGDAFLSLGLSNGTFLFRDLKTHKILGQGWLPTNSPETENDTFKRGEAHHRHWSVFGAGSPATDGRHLFIRGFDYLYCIGQK